MVGMVVLRHAKVIPSLSNMTDLESTTVEQDSLTTFRGKIILSLTYKVLVTYENHFCVLKIAENKVKGSPDLKQYLKAADTGGSKDLEDNLTTGQGR